MLERVPRVLALQVLHELGLNDRRQRPAVIHCLNVIVVHFRRFLPFESFVAVLSVEQCGACAVAAVGLAGPVLHDLVIEDAFLLNCVELDA